MHNHSYENEFNLHVNEISFSYEKMGTKTRFEEEAKGNSEMAAAALFLLSLPSTPNHHENGTLRKTLFKPGEFENAGFLFS